MSDNEKGFAPVVKTQPSLKVQIPNTPEGRKFLDELKRLLKFEELPFVQSCPSEQRHVMETTIGGELHANEEQGSTTYALDLRLEQEGFPP